MSFVIETKKKIYKLFPTQEPITAMVTGVKLQPNCETLYGKKTKVFIKITSNLKDDDGDSMSSLFSATASMGEKANLRRFCKQILGYDPGDVYNVTKLLGLFVRVGGAEGCVDQACRRHAMMIALRARHCKRRPQRVLIRRTRVGRCRRGWLCTLQGVTVGQ